MTIVAAIPASSPYTVLNETAAAVVLFDADVARLMLLDFKHETPLLRGVKTKPLLTRSLLDETKSSEVIESVLSEFRDTATRFGAPSIRYLVGESLLSFPDSILAVNRLREHGCLPMVAMTKALEHQYWAQGIRSLHRVEHFCMIEIAAKTTYLSVIRGGELPVFLELPIGSLTTYLDHVQNVVPDVVETRTLLEHLSYEMAKIDLPAVSGLPIFGIEQAVKDIVSVLRRGGEIPSGSNALSRSMMKTLLKPTDTARRLMQLRLLHELPGRVHLFYPETAILYTLLALLDCYNLHFAEEGLAEGYLLAQRYGFPSE